MNVEDILGKAGDETQSAFYARIIGTAVLYAAAAVNGAEAPPEVTEEQAQKAALAFMDMAAQADVVVAVDRHKAALMRAMLDIVKQAFEAGEKAANDTPPEGAPADAVIN
jgi:hypothetical protein